MKKALISILFLTLSVGAAFGQATAPVSPFSFSFSPSMVVPLGPGADLFDLGGGGKLSVEYAPPGLKSLSLGLALGYGYQLLQAQAGSSSDLEALASMAWKVPVTGGLSARAFAGAGGGFGFMNGQDFATGGGSARFEAGGGLAYAFNPNLALRMDVSYWLDLSYGSLLGTWETYGGLGVGLSLSMTPRAVTHEIQLAPKPRNLDIGEIALQSVFPIFRTWYDQNPVGTVVVKNTGQETISNVSVSFLIKQYMDGAKECASIASLPPGESRQVPLYALLNDSVLDVTEATKATSEVDAFYTEAGAEQNDSKTATIRIYNRNAMTWDDDRKAAAFVSGKDPWVMDLANNVTAMVKAKLNTNISRNLQLAMAMHEALRLYGLSYTPNPTTPYSQTSTHPEVVDFLRFPRQTLTGKAGDCSDLSILYASLFESMGVETAFITVPGHIFMAIDLGVTPLEAGRSVSDTGDLVVRDGKVWLPIETTLRDRGLLDAWQEGAREWKQCTAQSTAAFYPIHEAWKLYEPVGLAADGTTAKVPAEDQVTKSFATELDRYEQQEIAAQVDVINLSMARTGETARILNERGVVYARYGRLDLAAKDFQSALGKSADYVPALLNLGNLARMKSDAQAACDYYQRAAKVEPNNAEVLISFALAASTLGKNDEAATAYDTARRLDPQLAARYAYVAENGSTGTRAAEAGSAAVIWDEE